MEAADIAANHRRRITRVAGQARAGGLQPRLPRERTGISGGKPSHLATSPAKARAGATNTHAAIEFRIPTDNGRGCHWCSTGILGAWPLT
jgi:hypothetical protein